MAASRCSRCCQGPPPWLVGRWGTLCVGPLCATSRSAVQFSCPCGVGGGGSGGSGAGGHTKEAFEGRRFERSCAPRQAPHRTAAMELGGHAGVTRAAHYHAKHGHGGWRGVGWLWGVCVARLHLTKCWLWGGGSHGLIHAPPCSTPLDTAGLNAPQRFGRNLFARAWRCGKGWGGCFGALEVGSIAQLVLFPVCFLAYPL